VPVPVPLPMLRVYFQLKRKNEVSRLFLTSDATRPHFSASQPTSTRPILTHQAGNGGEVNEQGVHVEPKRCDHHIDQITIRRKETKSQRV
jgi:hypothetical protein